MQTITGASVAPNVVIAMAGISKVYVGEIVEQGIIEKPSNIYQPCISLITRLHCRF